MRSFIECEHCNGLIEIQEELRYGEYKCPHCSNFSNLTHEKRENTILLDCHECKEEIELILNSSEKNITTCPKCNHTIDSNNIINFGENYSVLNNQEKLPEIFSLEQIIKETFTLCANNFFQFFIIIAITHIFIMLIDYGTKFSEFLQKGKVNNMNSVLFIPLIIILVSSIGQGALVIAASLCYSNNPFSIKDCYQKALQRSVSLFGGAMIFLGGIVTIVLLGSFLGSLPILSLLVLFGGFLYFVPYSLYLPIIIVENAKAKNSFGKCHKMLANNRRQVIWVCITGGMIILFFFLLEEK